MNSNEYNITSKQCNNVLVQVKREYVNVRLPVVEGVVAVVLGDLQGINLAAAPGPPDSRAPEAECGYFAA